MLNFITANRLGGIRQETLKGKTYIVSNVRMIVPGVLTGNRGPLLYRNDEIRKSVFAWNQMPIVVDHPRNGSKYISARSPQVLDKVGVGFVFNAKQENGNLDAEAWIDIESLRAINPSLASKVEAGEPVEVSTGLGTDNEPSVGVFNGRNYTHVARNFAPDHLALLSQEKGACSLTDGCGLSVNEEGDDELIANEYLSTMTQLVRAYEESDSSETFSEWIAANGASKVCSCKGGSKPCGCTKNACGDKKKKTMNTNDEEETKDQVTSNSWLFTPAWTFNSGCGAGGGKGKSGFQRGNACTKGSGRAGIGKAKTATPAQKQQAKAKKSGGSSGGGKSSSASDDAKAKKLGFKDAADKARFEEADANYRFEQKSKGTKKASSAPKKTSSAKKLEEMKSKSKKPMDGPNVKTTKKGGVTKQYDTSDIKSGSKKSAQIVDSPAMAKKFADRINKDGSWNNVKGKVTIREVDGKYGKQYHLDFEAE